MRGLQWFNALSAGATAVEGLPNSLKVADGVLGEQPVRYIAVVTDAQNRFPRARNGEVGLLEGWGLAKAVDEAIARGDKRPIIAIVDVPSQAYGRREEALGIHQALAAAADSYARARLAGHPVIALLVGKAMSGAFLAHGYQANRLIALRDPGVMVHAMGKASAARVTLRSVEELEALAASVSVSQIEQPTSEDVARVSDCLVSAIKDIRSTDLSGRLGATNRAASSHVRQLLREQW
jgi:malonate decarboxylase gamma subunit